MWVVTILNGETMERISRCNPWNRWISPGKAAECFQTAPGTQGGGTWQLLKANLERNHNPERDQALTVTLVLSQLYWPSYHLTQLITNAWFVAQTIYISPGSPFLALLRGGEVKASLEMLSPGGHRTQGFSFSWSPPLGDFSGTSFLRFGAQLVLHAGTVHRKWAMAKKR